jgi:hypothetical protein
MWTWIGGAVSAIALLLLKIWIEYEIKDRGWPGLTHKLGNIGFIAMVLYSLLMLSFVVACIAYHYSYGMPQSFFWPNPREVTWFEGVTVPGLFATLLLFYRLNIMMFLSGMLEWSFGIFHLYVVFSSPLTKEDHSAAYMIANLEGFVGYSLIFIGVLGVVAMGSALISRLYGLVDTHH